MTAKFTVDGDNTKITFEFETTTEIIQDIAEDASHYLWKEVIDSDVVTNPFEELTNQEKLDLVNEHVKLVVMNLANTYKSIKAQTDARTLEKENEYSL